LGIVFLGARGGQDGDFFLLAGTVTALADAGALPVGLDELRGRALAWIGEADPARNFAAILGGVFVLLVCCRNEPGAVVPDFWVGEKLAGIVEAAPDQAEGFALIRIAFALLLAPLCPERAGGFARRAAGLLGWWTSCGMEREKPNTYPNWIAPVIEGLLPEDRDLSKHACLMNVFVWAGVLKSVRVANPSGHRPVDLPFSEILIEINFFCTLISLATVKSHGHRFPHSRDLHIPRAENLCCSRISSQFITTRFSEPRHD
jgi:hypothetical protein